MRKKNRAPLVFGILLILSGILFIFIRSNPEWQQWFQEVWEWPLTIVAIGGFLFLLGLILWEPGLAVPAVIVAGIGWITYYQVQLDEWMSWIYLWTLIPGFVGVGVILASVMELRWRRIWRGLDLILISGILYVIFASIFGGMTILGPYGPAILMIALGIYILIRGAVSARRKKEFE